MSLIVWKKTAQLLSGRSVCRIDTGRDEDLRNNSRVRQKRYIELYPSEQPKSAIRIESSVKDSECFRRSRRSGTAVRSISSCQELFLLYPLSERD